MRLVSLASLLFVSTVFGAGQTGTVSEAARRVEAQAAKLPPALGADFRALAARSLRERYPDLAKKMRAGTQQDFRMPPPAQPPFDQATGKRILGIRERMSTMGRLPTDADRARLAIQLAADIRALPAGPDRIGLAELLCSSSSEGDLGKEALSAVAGALADANRQAPSAGAYLELAGLLRYQHIPTPEDAGDAALEAADAVLALRRAVVQESDFTLTGLDGRSYSLSAMRGQVVLVNFWATSCPPCRKEMPDMEKLYQSLNQKGFTIFAISREPRETVAPFLRKQGYSFPALLDPDGKAAAAFLVEGLPESFLFNREGKLVSQAMEMRTGRQFLEMLKTAGL